MLDWQKPGKSKHTSAIFLDRDGTLNIDDGYEHRVEHLCIYPDVSEGLRLLQNISMQLIVVTNQSGIALGKFTIEEMHLFNAALIERLKRERIFIDAVFYCPHLDIKTIQAERLCKCSKPNPGLLIEAAGTRSINLEKSYLIGDRWTDVLAAKRVGCKTVLLQREKEAAQFFCTPDKIVGDFRDAAKWIVENVTQKAAQKHP